MCCINKKFEKQGNAFEIKGNYFKVLDESSGGGLVGSMTFIVLFPFTGY